MPENAQNHNADMIDPTASNNSLSKGDTSSPAQDPGEQDPGEEVGAESSNAAEGRRRPKKDAA